MKLTTAVALLSSVPQHASAAAALLSSVPQQRRHASASAAAAPTLSVSVATPSARHRVPDVACAASETAGEFAFAVDLGDDGGVVEHTLQPFFTRSSLVITRVPLPFELQADPVQGCWRMKEDGYGLRVGDVLRAFSTLAVRYDSECKTTRPGPGLPGVRDGEDDGAADDVPKWLQAFQQNWNPLTAFETQRPAKCLFVTDGAARLAVEDALVANEASKVKELVLIMERPE